MENYSLSLSSSSQNHIPLNITTSQGVEGSSSYSGEEGLNERDIQSLEKINSIFKEGILTHAGAIARGIVRSLSADSRPSIEIHLNVIRNEEALIEAIKGNNKGAYTIALERAGVNLPFEFNSNLTAEQNTKIAFHLEKIPQHLRIDAEKVMRKAQSLGNPIVMDEATRAILDDRAIRSMFILLRPNLTLEGVNHEENFPGKEADLETVHHRCNDALFGDTKIGMETEVRGNIKPENIVQVFLPKHFGQFSNIIDRLDLVTFVDPIEEEVFYKDQHLQTYRVNVTVPNFHETVPLWMQNHSTYPIISHLCRLQS